MSRAKLAILGAIVAVFGFGAFSALFTVQQTQQAMVLQFGNPVRVIQEPGLNIKMPFIQNVVYFDRRILDLDPPEQEVTLKDQKRINVDSFLRYKIIDPLEFRKVAQTDANFRQVFGNRLNSAVRAEVAKVLLGDMLTEVRAQVMDRITNTLKDQAPEFGVEVIDVRIGRTDLPEATSQAVYNRMRSDRVAQAAQLRAEGEELKLKIEAEADRERTVIIAEAQRQAEILAGQGEAQRNTTLSDAFGRDPVFFEFYRTMEAYEKSLGDGTTLVLKPDSEFFRYFNQAPPRQSE